MVFSPHFDDEVLGCGGMIVKKKRAGAAVKLVFMTDGSKSHQHLMAPSELAAIRYAEAIEAGRIMGLTRDDILALGFEEQALGESASAATERVTTLLEEHRPEEIWLPHSAEPLIWSPDHRDTTRLVKRAARRSGRTYAIYEYPVWLWFNYPWIDLRIGHRREALRLIKTSFEGAFGLRLTRTCLHDLDIRDVLDIKRAALAAYRSQMTRLKPDPTWATLADVANGQFLQCFFQPTETFATGRLDE
jgi:LmbE family N-acetylglucosaminyl deacetylase